MIVRTHPALVNPTELKQNIKRSKNCSLINIINTINRIITQYWEVRFLSQIQNARHHVGDRSADVTDFVFFARMHQTSICNFQRSDLLMLTTCCGKNTQKFCTLPYKYINFLQMLLRFPNINFKHLNLEILCCCYLKKNLYYYFNIHLHLLP